MKYDFILFENLYSVENHYKDLCILAQLLQKAGYSVAIVDAFKEKDLCKLDGVPHLKIDLKCPRLFREKKTYSKKRTGLISLFYRIVKDYYLFRVLKVLHGKAPNIYLGSMTLSTPAFFFQAFKSDTRYYMWALRSAHLLNWKYGKHGLYHYVSLALYKNVKRRDNLRLIVSNVLIKQEFENLVGIDRGRLILRPERIVLEPRVIAGKGKVGISLNLLSIGTLRPFKNVELCLAALESMGDNRIHYTIAGRCKDDLSYNKKINSLVLKMANVS